MMGWKSAKKPPKHIGNVLCKWEGVDLDCDEYLMSVGWYCERESKWVVFGEPEAVVVQWHEIPKGWKRKEKK